MATSHPYTPTAPPPRYNETYDYELEYAGASGTERTSMAIASGYRAHLEAKNKPGMGPWKDTPSLHTGRGLLPAQWGGSVYGIPAHLLNPQDDIMRHSMDERTEFNNNPTEAPLQTPQTTTQALRGVDPSSMFS